jgi:predicted DNA-binding protein (MmcQ/YjbR family)
MDIESFREYCLAKKGVTEETPFGPDVLVFKVFGKMFAACDIDTFESINLKCDPETAIELREQYPDAVLPGYHMSKKHWNTMVSTMPDSFLKTWTDHSYDLVFRKLPKSLRESE